MSKGIPAGYRYDRERQERYRDNEAARRCRRRERAAHEQQLVRFKDLSILDRLEVYPQETTMSQIREAMQNTAIIDFRQDGSTITFVTRSLDGRLDVIWLALADYKQQQIPQSIVDQIDARREA